MRKEKLKIAHIPVPSFYCNFFPHAVPFFTWW